MSSPGKRVTAASIPTITVLRDQLDYGDSQSKRCDVFYDDIRVFRKKYRSSTGLSGDDLHNWKSPEHQAALTEMSRAFLDTDGNGSRYWPDDDGSSNRNKLQYSRHRGRIQQLVKQLFFRLNQQHYRNVKYKKKGHPSVDDPSRGRSTEDAIDVDALKQDESVASRGPKFNKPLHSGRVPDRTTVAHSPSSSGRSGVKAQELEKNAVPESGPSEKARIAKEDVWTVLRSPVLSPSSIRSPPVKNMFARYKLGNTDTSTSTKRELPSQFDPTLAQPAKRLKAKPGVPTDDDHDGFDRHLSSSSLKRSPRTKRPILHTDRATDEEVNEAIATPRVAGTPVVDDEDYLRLQSPSGINKSIEEALDLLEKTTPTPAHAEDELPNPPQNASSSSLGTRAEQQDKTQRATSSSATYRSSHGHLPTPASTVSDPHESRHESEARNPSKQPVQVEIAYNVILSRDPVFETKGWEPKGKFQDKSLEELLRELALTGDVEGLVFTLEGPGVRAEQSVPRDNENRFELMKRNLNKHIRTCLTRHTNAKGPLLLEITIEPQRGLNETEDAVADAGAFEF